MHADGPPPRRPATPHRSPPSPHHYLLPLFPSAADYTLTLPDVHYVTIRQLLAWMQNPVPKDQLTPEMLGCGNPGGAPSNLAEERRRLRRA